MSSTPIWKKRQIMYGEAAYSCGLKVGDYVRIVGKRKFGDNGWATHWSEIFMTPLIGKVGRVIRFEGTAGWNVHVSGEERTWNFPFEVLKKISKEEGEKEYEYRSYAY